MEDLFDAITRTSSRGNKKARKGRRREETLAGSTLSEAMGGRAYGDRDVDSAWLDLDHAIAASSARGRLRGSSIQDEFDSSSSYEEDKFGGEEEEADSDSLSFRSDEDEDS